MKVELIRVTIRQIVESFSDNGEKGVVGLNGNLDIRPIYQREFVYKDKQQQAVITSIRSKLPLNIMYWVDHGDGTFEVLDGQQRTMSFCRYVNSCFSVDHRFFHNLTEEDKNEFLDYELTIYTCIGTEAEKLGWFETINLAGEKLTKQELRNSVYPGSFISDSKRYFSRTSCAAYQVGSDYLKGVPIRQDYLETALSWISQGKIEAYMAAHQHDEDATELWEYYRRVINWVKSTFPVKRVKEMKGVNWGDLFNKFGMNHYDPDDLEKEVQQLLIDDDVTKKSGVYTYVLTRNEKFLSIRAFSDKIKRQKYEQQGGHCTHCGEHHEIKGMEADHIIPWSQGGGTLLENCQMLCVKCNREKSDK